MNENRDPLQILATTTDPKVAAWAMNQLSAAGFADVQSIALDFGWQLSEIN